MRLGISTRGLEQGSYAISTIVLQLTRKIIELAGSEHEIILYGNNTRIKELFPPEVTTHCFQLNNRFAWDQIWLPHALKKDRVDVALFMKGTMPIFLPARGAVIFHDLGYFDTKLRPYRPYETIYMKAMMKRAAKEACVIFADSQYTRDEVLRIFSVAPKKIHVCYQDVSPVYIPLTDEIRKDEIRTRYGLPDNFMISPISISPRKNLSRILDAFMKIQDKIPHDIVLTGGQYWGINGLVQRVNLEFNHRVHILGHVPDEDMPGLYSLADFALYPSLLEGFGMPVLEAFRCGCPILTSNISSIPEVAGDAAYLVNPYDVDQIGKGILELATDHILRHSLKIKGFEQAKIFSWGKTARVIVDALQAC